MRIELNVSPPQSAEPEPVGRSGDHDDSDLVVVASPRSRTDAAKIQAVLNASGVRSCLGPDNAENVEAFRGDFAQPVDLKVYLPFAGIASALVQRLEKSIPAELEYDARVKDEDEEEEDNELERDVRAVDGQESDEAEEEGIQCPKCHSPEVVFDSRESDGKEVEPEAAKIPNTTGTAMPAVITGRMMASRNRRVGRCQRAIPDRH